MPEINSPESIIVYGGSFNPLHMSHVLVHAALSAYFPLAQKWIVASYSHAFDKQLMDYERRLSVLRSVFDQSPQTVVSDIEARRVARQMARNRRIEAHGEVCIFPARGLRSPPIARRCDIADDRIARVIE